MGRGRLYSISPHPVVLLFFCLRNSEFHPELLILEIIKTMGANSGGGDGL